MDSLKMYALAGCAALVLILAGTLSTIGAWYYRGEKADKEVAQVRADMEQFIMKERQLTDHWRERSQKAHSELMTAIGNIKVVHTTVTRNIQVEVDSNPGFYSQPLPEGGRQAWVESRSVMQ